MTKRRWIANEFSAARAALTGANAQHLARVLRARVGQEFEISCGDQVRLGAVSSVSNERVEFALGAEVVQSDESARRVSLWLAVFKFDRMGWAIEKATELGVADVTPVIAQRTDAHLAVAAQKRVERWQRVAKEASQQSRRASEPVIHPPVKLQEAVNRPTLGGRRIVLDETEKTRMLSEETSSLLADDCVDIAVGPEGGWTTEELKLFAASGWKSASLGRNILRAETAVVAALAIVMSGPGGM